MKDKIETPVATSATEEEIDQLIAETLLINAIKRRQGIGIERGRLGCQRPESEQHPASPNNRFD